MQKIKITVYPMCGDSYINTNVLKFIELYKRKKVILLYDHVKNKILKNTVETEEGSAVPSDSAGRRHQAICKKKATCERL